ncbi:hypothetical protein DL95DRAFT_410597 [Leptodontidium sp. 2 PMI_412]|nr:hypothetical protein DL95DRAFT_410597 [Leptodontidium sp. 2 PMI_412]
MDLRTLHTDIDLAKATEKTGAFDRYDEHNHIKQESSRNWFSYLDGAHAVIDELLEEFEDSRTISDADKAATRVKVAVLGTGFQAPKGLHENYVALGKVSATESENFVDDGVLSGSSDWQTDNDGHMHGTTVARIIINIAPVADVHVARVFEKGEDLDNPKAATQVYRRIAEAIERATEKWKVDLIVMSFSFSQPIEQIREAMAEASKSAKPPLFFVATRNDGANEDVAWPARGTTGGVFGSAQQTEMVVDPPSTLETTTLLTSFTH